MAANYDPRFIFSSDFFQDKLSDDVSPSSNDIETVMGIQFDEESSNWLDSISGEEAYKILLKLLESLDRKNSLTTLY